MTLAIARPDLTDATPSKPGSSAPARDEVAAAIAGVRQCAWALLVVWAIASVAANGVHAWLVQPPNAPLPPLAAAAFGVLAPLALLGITELIARLLRLAQQMRDSARIVYVSLGLAILGAVGIAAAAFRLSFEALAEFGEMCGVSPGLAWLVPCVIDGAILTADVAVVAASTAARLGPITTTDTSFVADVPQVEAPVGTADQTAQAAQVETVAPVSLVKPKPRPSLPRPEPAPADPATEVASAPRPVPAPPAPRLRTPEPKPEPEASSVAVVPAVRPAVRPRVNRHHREDAPRRPRVQLVMPQPSVAAVGE
ncbi:DUF2637 domain-containing protein [Nocardia farcinica]|uniref:DUF2637 domain-containing protein n=1 Tax=Nocardia farcinica TaxID=37329 RepID=UPI00189323E9|nr:DUF2637 domain-containing protein [Nocardia farcinica]MBF6388122.1 DUF2637 domain-containing protein [Nocardia farcinica]UEX26380.1 DUF2637 domain-containing protein [Nocardia farcinica]